MSTRRAGRAAVRGAVIAEVAPTGTDDDLDSPDRALPQGVITTAHVGDPDRTPLEWSDNLGQPRASPTAAVKQPLTCDDAEIRWSGA